MSEIKRALFRVKDSTGQYVTAHVQTETSMVIHKDTNLEQFLEGFEPSHLGEIQEQVADVVSKLETLNQTTESQKNQLTNQAEQLQNQEIKIQSQEELIVEINSELDLLKEKLDDFEISIPENDELSNRLEAQEQTIIEINSQLDSLKSKLDNFTDPENAGIVERLEAQQELITEIRSDIEALEELLANYNPSTPDDSETVKQLVQQVRDLEQRFETFETSLANKANIKHNHEITDVAGLAEKIEKMDEMTEQVKTIEDQLSDMKASSQIYYQTTEPKDCANGSLWIVG